MTIDNSGRDVDYKISGNAHFGVQVLLIMVRKKSDWSLRSSRTRHHKCVGSICRCCKTILPCYLIGPSRG